MSAILAGNRVKELRKAAGMTQGRLAELCGVSREAVNRIENGSYGSPTLELADRMALALGCTLYDLFELMSSATERDQREQIRRETSEATLRNLSSLAAKFA